MARRNNRVINVKIATTKIIKALETRFEKLEKDYATQSENEAKHEKTLEKWRKELSKYAIANFTKAENLRINYRSYNKTLNIDFDIAVLADNDFPPQPERNFEVLSVHTYEDMKEELSNAIRILKMTDEEYVSTSTYNSISKYL